MIEVRIDETLRHTRVSVLIIICGYQSGFRCTSIAGQPKSKHRQVGRLLPLKRSLFSIYLKQKHQSF